MERMEERRGEGKSCDHELESLEQCVGEVGERFRDQGVGASILRVRNSLGVSEVEWMTRDR